MPIVFLFLSLLAASPEDQIRNAETHWARTVQSGNAAELEKIFTSGLIYAHATGVVQDRKQFLDQIRSGTRKYQEVKQESLRVVMYGDSAVAHSIMRMIGVNDKGPFNDHVMMMHLWVKQGGEWRLAAHQTTKLP